MLKKTECLIFVILLFAFNAFSQGVDPGVSNKKKSPAKKSDPKPTKSVSVPVPTTSESSSNKNRTTVPQKTPPRPSVSAVLSPMTDLQEFYYRVAIYGYARTKTFGKPNDNEGYDNVNFFGETFDNDNYKRAMADEFERNRYRTRIRAKIEEEVRKVNFNQKFTLVGYEKLGEYSFERHSFPIGSQTSVNGNQFASELPMSEADASAFVKSRASASGNINRTVKVRITYSVVNDRAGFSLLNAVYTPYFNYFIYSVEVFGDENMTQKMGVIPRINLVPNNGEEWRLAKTASLTPTKEIGKYRYLPDEKADGKIHNPLEQRPQMFGVITLTDVGIMVSGEQSNGNSRTERCDFFDTPAVTIGRSNTKIQTSWNDSKDSFSITGYGCHLQFETQQERDRFFVDFTRTFQEWKTKYADFKFAVGKLTINYQCTRGKEAAPCADSTSSNQKPVWQTQTYRVTVESLERNANKYIANLVFENFTSATIKIGWEKKSPLLPDAVGPYLIDENSHKYFVEGMDSGGIITSSFVMAGEPVEIAPKTKLTSRFVFTGNNNGTIFNLEAKGIEWPVGKPITIEGLKVTLDGNKSYEEKIVSREPSVAISSSNMPVVSSTTTTNNLQSFETLIAAIERDNEVFLKVKCDAIVYPRHNMYDGLVSLSKTTIAFKGQYCDDFASNYSKILELTYQPQAYRIYLKLAIKNKKGDKEEKREYYIYNTGSTAPEPGNIIRCNSCDNSLNILYNLLQNIRASVITPSAELEASVSGRYVSKGHYNTVYLDLKLDGTFSLQEGEKIYKGTYAVQGSIISFQVKGDAQYYLLGVLLGHFREVVKHDETIVLRKFTFGENGGSSISWERQP